MFSMAFTKEQFHKYLWAWSITFSEIILLELLLNLPGANELYTGGKWERYSNMILWLITKAFFAGNASKCVCEDLIEDRCKWISCSVTSEVYIWSDLHLPLCSRRLKLVWRWPCQMTFLRPWRTVWFCVIWRTMCGRTPCPVYMCPHLLWWVHGLQGWIQFCAVFSNYARIAGWLKM